MAEDHRTVATQLISIVMIQAIHIYFDPVSICGEKNHAEIPSIWMQVELLLLFVVYSA